MQQAAPRPLTDTAKLNSIYTQLEKDFLQQQPEIPLWYNGAWFQGNTQYWHGLPVEHGHRPEHARSCGTATSAR